MTKLTTMVVNFLLISFAVVLAKPAKEALDKATDNDVDINSVHPEKNSTIIQKTVVKDFNLSQVSTDDKDFHTSVSFGTPTTVVIKPRTAFAQLIDDIFQIPIGILQNVASLLRTPFISAVKTPEKVSSY